jgi:hypothetical protein
MLTGCRKARSHMRTTWSFEKQAVQPLETHTFINVIRHDKQQSLHILMLLLNFQTSLTPTGTSKMYCNRWSYFEQGVKCIPMHLSLI